MPVLVEPEAVLELPQVACLFPAGAVLELAVLAELEARLCLHRLILWSLFLVATMSLCLLSLCQPYELTFLQCWTGVFRTCVEVFYSAWLFQLALPLEARVVAD